MTLEQAIPYALAIDDLACRPGDMEASGGYVMPATRSTPLRNAETPTLARAITCPVLIGRDSMVATLRHAINVVNGGQRQIVLVTGEAGIGKSRLVV